PTWNIPAERSKNGHPHTVPLTPLALSIIDAATGARSPLVADGSGIFDVSRNVVSDIIWRYGQTITPGNGSANGNNNWTAHDLRRTALTGMARLGVSPIVIANVANHRSVSKAGVTLGIYIQHTYEAEKRDALTQWATRLQTIVR